jgi:hypothetical protein
MTSPFMNDFTQQCFAELTSRLDAALKRIEALELAVAKLKGPRQPHCDKCGGPCRACQPSPLPDEGT